MKNKVLIIIAHPDDEILWMGGTIQKLISSWKKLSVLLLGKPWTARPNEDPQTRLEYFRKIAARLWIKKLYYGSFPDVSFDTIPLFDIIRKVEEVIQEEEPEIVYTHFYNDLNVDHSITSKAVMTALRPIEKFYFVKKIFFFEVLSTTELSIWNDKFIPQHYENIGDFIEKKKELFSIYNTELRSFPHPMSYKWIETLAQYRGMQSALEFAEAFMLYRSIN